MRTGAGGGDRGGGGERGRGWGAVHFRRPLSSGEEQKKCDGWFHFIVFHVLKNVDRIRVRRPPTESSDRYMLVGVIAVEVTAHSFCLGSVFVKNIPFGGAALFVSDNLLRCPSFSTSCHSDCQTLSYSLYRHRRSHIAVAYRSPVFEVLNFEQSSVSPPPASHHHNFVLKSSFSR